MQSTSRTPWVRSKDAPLAGVCAGLAKIMDVEPYLVRLGLIIFVFFGGVGILAYVLLALSMPREDNIDNYYSKKLLGVCLALSKKLEIDLVMIRFATLVLMVTSFGVGVVVYIALFFGLKLNDAANSN
jgi:phage shock protein C